MKVMKVWTQRVGLAACFLMVPAFSAAQSGVGSIAGTVRDTSGAVLPGVTVEATSPALIEKVRTVVTNGEGQYQIIDLPIGAYTVTFTLPGFNGVKREGLKLTTGFTASVNAELKVGDVTETVTVSGASPVVDLQNTKQQTVMTREVIDTIPTGHMYSNMLVLVPGMTYGTGSGVIAQDVGGQAGLHKAAYGIHGGRFRDQQLQVDGMSVEVSGSDRPDATGNNLVQANFQEFAIDYSGNSAEVEGGGVRVNHIPREGSNSFRSRIYGDVSASGLQTNNLTDRLRALGLKDANRLKQQWSVYSTLGGPVKQDRLWFFGAGTLQRNDTWVADTYYSKDPAAWVYEPDLTRQGVEDLRVRDGAVRLTWQATPRNKFAGFVNRDWYCRCHMSIGKGTTPEASTYNVTPGIGLRVDQVSWMSTVTSRLVAEAGAGDAWNFQDFTFEPESVASPITDSGLGVRFRATNRRFSHYDTKTFRGSLAYVTGSHAVKVGFTHVEFFMGNDPGDSIGHVNFTTLNGVPTQVTYLGDPTASRDRARNLGIFVQDQWRVRRLTVNAGVRFDNYHSWFPEQHVPATEYVRAPRDLPRGEGTKWRDLSPRLGVSYDLFGTGKTALKATASRYVTRYNTNTETTINPIASNNSNPRRWTDANRDYIVQGDPFNPAANEELGPSTNLNFGKPITTASFDPAWAIGFNVRPYNWEFSAAIQHELAPSVALNAGYFRRIYGNFGVTENVRVAASDFSPFCVTAPVDPRLPGGGGNQICGLYDLNPSKVGQSFSLLAGANKYGDQFDHWNGVDVTINARLQGVLLQAGLSTGKAMRDYCAIATQYPQVVTNALSGGLTDTHTSGANASTHFCRVDYPFLTQGKLLGSYRLPGDVQVAATYQDAPGPEIRANAVFTSAQVAPSLGRPLASASTVSVNVVPPGTLYGERLRQVDLRFSKGVTVGGKRLEGMVDLFNAMNANPVLLVNNTYGATTGPAAGAVWQVPQGILPGRTIKFTVQMDF